MVAKNDARLPSAVQRDGTPAAAARGPPPAGARRGARRRSQHERHRAAAPRWRIGRHGSLALGRRRAHGLLLRHAVHRHPAAALLAHRRHRLVSHRPAVRQLQILQPAHERALRPRGLVDIGAAAVLGRAVVQPLPRPHLRLPRLVPRGLLLLWLPRARPGPP